MRSNTAALGRLTYTALDWHHCYCFVLLFFLPSVFLPYIIFLHNYSCFLLPVCMTVKLCAVFNMLRGHMSTPNTTEQIHYFVCVHSSFGPIRVLAFCYCHAWWGFLCCLWNMFQWLSAEARIHTILQYYLQAYLHRTRCLKTETVEWYVCLIFWAFLVDFEGVERNQTIDKGGIESGRWSEEVKLLEKLDQDELF